MRKIAVGGILVATWLLPSAGVGTAGEPAAYVVCVSNERSGTLTIIRDGKPVATIPVGKRPRGVHASPDGLSLYVALSGSPITGPPALDARGNPILKEDDDEENADHAADGIGVVDLRAMRAMMNVSWATMLRVQPGRYALPRTVVETRTSRGTE